MRKFSWIHAVLLTAGFMLAGCSTPPSPEKDDAVLRVGTSADYPPMAFIQDQQLLGAEIDLAHTLATSLGKKMELVELGWNDLIPALEAGKVDILMSGLSITEPRKMRVAFSDPYLETGQMVLFRRADTNRYPNRDSIVKQRPAIGVKPGTTGDTYVQKNIVTARRVPILKPQDAPFHLKNRRIDIYVHDGPAVLWLAGSNESDLTLLPETLNRELLAWAVSPENPELLSQVNTWLAGIKQDGTLARILQRWLPLLNTNR